MELVTFANPNAATMRNVLFFAKKKFPRIVRVFFLDVPVVEGQVFDDSARRVAAERYIDPQVEISAKRIPVKEMSVLIPQLVAERVRVNGGRDRLIVDLTNGTKNMSCLLYAAASLIRIPNLFFLLVDRASQGVDTEPSDIPEEHVKVDLLDPISNTRTIGRAGLFDICYYKDQYEACLARIEQQKFRDNFLRGQMATTVLSAVDHYFDERYPECVSLLGALSESVLVELCLAIKNAARGEIKVPVPSDPAQAMNWLQSQFVDPVRGKLREDHSNAQGTLSEYQWNLRYLVPAYTVLDQLRVLRNFASHPYDDFRSEREASVALHALLYLMQIIASSGVFT